MLSIIKADITSLQVEAIVNAANNKLAAGGGVCGAIFSKCGDKLVKYCNSFKLVQYNEGTVRCKTGDAVITPAFDMHLSNTSIKYIIHAVGPVYVDGNRNEAKLLASAYRKSVEIAISCGIKSIAFPFISSGIYGYPIDECAKIAIDTLKFIENQRLIDITMCAYSDSDLSILKEHY